MKSKLSILLLALVALLALSCANPVNPDPPPAEPTLSEQWAAVPKAELRQLLIDAASLADAAYGVEGNIASVPTPLALQTAAPDIFAQPIWAAVVNPMADPKTYEIWVGDAASDGTQQPSYVFVVSYAYDGVNVTKDTSVPSELDYNHVKLEDGNHLIDPGTF